MKKPEYIEISLYGNTYRIKVPKEVPAGKVDIFSEYIRLQKRIEMEGLMEFKDKYGRNHHLPLSDRKLYMYCKGMNDTEKGEIERKNREAQALSAQISMYKLQLSGKSTPVESREKKLVEEYTSEILELLGKGYTSSEVHKALLDKGVDIRYADIQNIHINNKAKVAEMRTSYNEDLGDVTLYSKRCRLERLSYLLNEMMDNFESSTNPGMKQKISAEARAIIEQARKEVEGEEVKLTVQGRIDVDATINVAAVTLGIGEGLTIPQLVIARTAARLGMRSQYFIDHLANSYYAKYSGFRKNDDLRTKPIYPTAIAYDIMDVGMEQKNQEWQKNQKSYEEPDDQDAAAVKESDDSAKKEMRRRLIEILSKNKQ